MKIASMFLTVASTAAMSFTGLTATTQVANARVYCTYIGYPHGCVARPGVHLVARPAGVGGAPRAGNINGGVNRAGRR